MRFNNYRNPYTNDNKIYSFKDLYDMPFGELIRKKQEVLGQYRVLGVPRDEELQSSENVVYVEAYTRDDGTEVKAHYRSKPNSSSSNSKGNNNSINIADDISANETKKQIKNEDFSSENQEADIIKTKEKQTQEMMYPDEVAGVKRGEPKTFEQMIQQGVNPKYMSDEDEGDYSDNCQSCTVAAELYIRGYDVEAGPYSTQEAKELGNNGETAYLDPETGEKCVADIIFTNEIDCYDYLEQNVKQNERYELTYNTPTESGNAEYDKENENKAHIVLITRDKNGQILYHDPQDGTTKVGADAKAYLKPWFEYEHTIVSPPRILRVDDKALNPKYVNKVVKKRNGN